MKLRSKQKNKMSLGVCINLTGKLLSALEKQDCISTINILYFFKIQENLAKNGKKMEINKINIDASKIKRIKMTLLLIRTFF